MLLLADFDVGYPSSPAFSSLWSFLVCHFQVLRIQRPRRGHCSHSPWRGAEFAGPENGGPKGVFRDIFVKSGSINVKPRPKWSPAHSTHTALSLYHTRCLRSDPAVRSVLRSLRWPDRTKFLLKSKKPHGQYGQHGHAPGQSTVYTVTGHLTVETVWAVWYRH